ncbi:hypothetical protein I601_3626 [Nocardioides dokdonensis FR1436]|uniref:Membrane protein YczE n=1 Tax=Nocardioides dokdonensis FR1436 TaxID=1300347 RepID=A0A1A9GQV9_9ACTN|nr:hypothetical protein [Nocardioides dokdonensis]ANH40032.1 hypothetical protein I601_3626 [Nocardioides dokdonensis FR1436]
MVLHPGRTALVVGGCVVLGAGVAMLLSADLGSDGYSTLVNGVAQRLGVSFWSANLAIGVLFLLLAAWRRVYPGPGTLIQVVVVGATVSAMLDVLTTPGSLLGQLALLVAAIPVLAVGIAAYLGSQLGAGPTEAAALAWDPPLPFRWSYSLVQGGGALVGWLLGATVGAGTIAVILLLGPAAGLAARLLRLDVRQRHGGSDRGV